MIRSDQHHARLFDGSLANLIGDQQPAPAEDI